MIPSVIASEVEEALVSFLATQFQPSNAALSGVIDEFLVERDNVIKGPYLSIALPFLHDTDEDDPFPGLPLGFVPYRHQRTAFRRLAKCESTVIATGTGSGKTECFLFPILDACRRRSGEAGIKAILIYPMNALATDQAGRIARIIHQSDALRGKVTAGIYVGQDGPSPYAQMSATQIISNHQTLVEHPPDILLTNYKMLDYLLSRPTDQRLWRHNQPDTLSWLVVDELHTFDGAQGTDLACLIRRLKSRLGVTGDSLTCVGTSATLGEAGKDRLRDYVSRIFDTSFGPGSIVGETRESIDGFLGSAIISDVLVPTPALGNLVDHRRFDSTEAYIRAQFELFFGETPGDDFLTDEWRCALSGRLRSHVAFVNLLRILHAGPRSLDDVLTELCRGLPSRNDTEATGILNGLCALIAVARTRDGAGDSARLIPFLRLSFHLWARELKRMVCRVDMGADLVRYDAAVIANANASGGDRAESRCRLKHSDDLGPHDRGIHLPLVQCNSCRVTGWGATLNGAADRVETDLRQFYNQFFARQTDVQVLFPENPPGRQQNRVATLCGECGRFAPGSHIQTCDACGSTKTLQVFFPDLVVERRHEGRTWRELQLDCPYCLAENSLFIFGARSSSLLSVALGQTFVSRHNDDRKVIAFSDNVQDAAYRAGFLAHRTWRNCKRTAITQALPESGSIRLDALPDAVLRRWSSHDEKGALDPNAFVERFIAPDRTWRRSFKDFQQSGQLGPDSELAEIVRERLEWEALAEVGYSASIAHSLERARVVAVGPDLDRLDGACVQAQDRISEELGELESIDLRQVRWLALGILRRMKDRGAIFGDRVNPLLRYIADGASLWALTSNPALPEFGPATPHPRFPGERPARQSFVGIDPLVTSSGKTSWYMGWTEKVLGQKFRLLSQYHPPAVLEIVLDCMNRQDLIRLLSELPAWAIAPDAFHVTRELAAVRASNPARTLIVPRDEAPLWLGAPCLEQGVGEQYEAIEDQNLVPTWAGRMYQAGEIHRIVAEEHTALLTRELRERLQTRFAASQRRPCDPNMLSATPTLELGIDVGDLSMVALCSVPPAQANYIQRAGRAGRRDGNAFILSLASATPHDQYFYAKPLDMLAGDVQPPDMFLNAPAVLERQLTSFCLDNWAATCRNPDAVPQKLRGVLDNVEGRSEGSFPYTFFSYTAKHAKSLLRRFLELFEESLTEDSRLALRIFLQGEPGKLPQLEVRMLERFDQKVQERDSYSRERERLRRQIRKLESNPQDEGGQVDRSEAVRERNGLQKLVRDINDRDTFGFLTDEGLIPNYAFPEEGVTLRSVILRRPASKEISQSTARDASQGQDLEVYEYLRPAAAALSELAPSSRFYAGGHRVTIDRVDLGLTKPETWRLCPSCTYCERIDPGRDEHSACPRCGDSMWADSGQVRTMLPLRLVHATTPAKRAQIMDDRDDRESAFFNRHLVADFDPTAERRTFSVPPPDPPFAFEYAVGTTFREMNFGRVSRNGQPTRYAGREIPRDGFRVCQYCGKVQSRRTAGPEHTLSCPRRDFHYHARLPDTSGFGDTDARQPADKDMLDCLYLYREFVSESLRMLVPVVEEFGSGPRVQSFIAAVELGLREKFGGRIDHIRAMNSRSPGAGDEPACSYVTLYDTVPGGTGYLKQLTESPAEVMDVFEAARRRLRACDCVDGCYSCVFAYRRGQEMKSTSKRLAIDLMDQVLEHANRLQPVPSIDQVSVRGLMESQLEARFISALEQRSRTDKRVSVKQEIVRGKAGFVVQVGTETWYVEPQADLTRADGVAVRSRPDFLFRPAREGDRKRPVAVFLDGFRYHKKPSADDAIKRTSIVRAGYVQWSLSWHDLDVAFGPGAAFSDLLRETGGGPSAAGQKMRPLQERLDAKWSTGPLRSGLREPSFVLLLRYLGDPDTGSWGRAVFTEMLCTFDQSTMGDAEFGNRFREAAGDTLPGPALDVLGGLDEPVYRAGRGRWLGAGDRFVDLFVALSNTGIQQTDVGSMFAAVHLHDRQPDSEGYRDEWNCTLRTFNLLQFLPRAWWSTSRAVSSGGYPEFTPVDTVGTAVSDGWRDAVALVDPDVQELAERMARLGIAVPEIGFDLTGGGGAVMGTAEMAWPARKLAVLTADEPAGAFETLGWRVWTTDVRPEEVQTALAAGVDGGT